MTPPPDPLDAALEELRVTPSSPPGLRREIWQRIAAAESSPDESPDWRARLAAVFARPSFTIAFVTACMLLGLFLAEVRITRAESARSRQIAQSYLALINPLLSTNSPSTARTP